MGYVFRHGKRIEVETAYPVIPQTRRKSFEPQWVKLPRHWYTALKRSKSASTYELALAILWEAFKDRNRTHGRVVILSTEITQMPGNSRRRATEELVKFGLIQIEEQASGKRATKVRLR